MSAAYYPQVQKIYVAYYGRPADPAGLQYWAGQLANNGGNLASIINAFGNAPESTALYAGADNAAKVTAIYQQLFNRAPDSAGLAFYVNELSLNKMTASSIALNVANGATGVDATYLTNKLTVASAFTDALTIDPTANVAYGTGTTLTTVRALISGVTTSGASTNVASTIAAIKPGGGAAATGQTFTLTTATDELVTGTSGSDTFNGLVSATAAKITFNTGDSVIDGSSKDSDTLVLTAQDDVADAPTVKGIEKILVHVDAISTPLATGTVLNMAADNIDAAAYTFDVTRAGSAVSGLTLTNLKDGSSVTTTSDFTAIDVDAASGTSSLTVTAGAKGSVGSPVTVTGTGAMANLTISGGHLSVTASDATGAVTVAGTGNVTVVDATKAVALDVKTTGGNVVITDADSASIVKVNAVGNITATAANALKAASVLELVSTGTVKATLAAAASTSTATLSGKGSSNTFTDTTGVVKELNLSGNGGAATFDLSMGTSVLNTINLSGSQNVTVKMNAADVEDLTVTTGYGGGNNALAIVDGSTGTSKLVLQTAAGDADLSNSTGLDVVELAFDQATKTITLPATAAVLPTVIISAGQVSGDTTLAGPSSTKTTNSVAITLDDDTRASGVADFGTAGNLILTSIKTATIDASVDTTASGTSNTHSFFKITGTNQNANVTIKGGVNALDLGNSATGAINLGVGSLTITGSGALTLGHTGGGLVTAGVVDASAVTGDVTAANVRLTSTPVFKTGSGADTITLTSAAGTADSTIESGAGNDTIVTFGGDYGAQNRTFNMGDGTDTLEIVASTVLAANTGKSISLSGIEVIQVNADATIGADLLSGKTYTVQSDDGTADNITVEVTSATTIDLSTLVESTVTAKLLTGHTFITNASAKTSGYNITGANNAINTITGSATAADTLVGGAKADTINGGLGDTLTGGAGNDLFDVSGTAAGGATATNFVTITDYATNSSATAYVDRIELPSTPVIATTGLSGWNDASDGIFTKTGATVSDFVTVVKAATFSAHNTYAFATGTDLYIYDVGATSATSDDVLVKLTGIVTLGLGVEPTANAISTAGFVYLK